MKHLPVFASPWYNNKQLQTDGGKRTSHDRFKAAEFDIAGSAETGEIYGILMPKKRKSESTSLVIDFENVAGLSQLITRQELSLVLNHYLKLYDDRVIRSEGETI